MVEASVASQKRVYLFREIGDFFDFFTKKSLENRKIGIIVT